MNAPSRIIAAGDTLPRTRRRYHKVWTRAEDARLRVLWGDMGGRALRETFGRTASAIYQRSRFLGLPPQSEVARLVPLNTLAVRLGVTHAHLKEFLARCAIAPTLRTPATPLRAPRVAPQLVVEAVQIETLMTQRDTRSATRRGWGRERGLDEVSVRGMVQRCGVGIWNAAPRCQVRLPVGVLDEVLGGEPGPWCAIWAAVLAQGPLVCDAWLLALAAHDLVHVEDPAQREWVDWLSMKALVQARRIARHRTKAIARTRRGAA